MTEQTYPIFYGAQRVTLAQLDDHATFSKCEPQMKNRLKAIIGASKGKLGIGTAWRSSATQEHTFRQRYTVSKYGTTWWNGQRWAHTSGAKAAPPGSSFHELGLAVDFVGDLAWAHSVADHFDLFFATWGNEVWHAQPLHDYRGHAFSHSVSQWKRAGRPSPKSIFGGTQALPTHPEPVHSHYPLPTLKLGSHSHEVGSLQHQLRDFARQLPNVSDPGNADGRFGPRTKSSLQSMQKGVLHVGADGEYGPKTYLAYVQLGEYLHSLSHSH